MRLRRTPGRAPTLLVTRALRGSFGFVGLLGAAFAVPKPSLAAVFVLVAIAGAIAADVAGGIAAYRRTMRAAWPSVPPLTDDDWD